MKTRAARAGLTGLAAVTHHVAGGLARCTGGGGASSAAAALRGAVQFRRGTFYGRERAAAGQRVLVGSGC